MENTLQNKINTVESELNQEFEQRQDVIAGLLLGLISKTNLMLLGEPGTGKSALLSRFSQYFPTTDSNTKSKPFFKIQFTGQTKVDSVIGPVDLGILKTQSRLVNRTENYAPNARICLFDEFARGGQSTDLLLTLINEREIAIDGQIVKCPLEMAVGATNHRLETDQLEAIRDRFLQWFNPLSIDLDNETALMHMWTLNRNTVVTNTISEAELKQIRDEANAITIPESTMKSFINIIKSLRSELGIHLSDRRTCMMIQLFKAQAWRNNHAEVEDSDLISAIPCCWVNPADCDKVRDLITKMTDMQMYRISQIQNEAYLKFEDWVMNGKQSVNHTNTVINQFKDYIIELNGISKSLKPKNQAIMNQACAMIHEFQKKLSEQILKIAF